MENIPVLLTQPLVVTSRPRSAGNANAGTAMAASGRQESAAAEVLEHLLADVVARAAFAIDDLGGILAFYTKPLLPPRHAF